ncbi:ShlB/FhaC/HecB family hemolysin secretion/activation protein [Roseateles sp. NT4]|uniref:ShlB/FhaC/HecB family hemolysin secretion/activation protein n=1 Tax=Roseateles sp. NT4 TaxID=3453715 RepID=UPI003EECDB14
MLQKTCLKWMALLAWGLSTLVHAVAAEVAPQGVPPTLSVQLEIRGGKAAIASTGTTLSQPLPEVYRQCGMAADSLQRELTSHLEPLLLGGDKLLTRLVLQSLSGGGTSPDSRAIVRALDALAKTDAATDKLWNGDFRWVEGPQLVQAWEAAQRKAGSSLVNATLMFSDAYTWALQNPAYADGPLLPKSVNVDESPGRERARRGIVAFEVAPPLVDAVNKLRPTYNVAQWDAVRSKLSHSALAQFDCKLWYRPRIETAVRDYLEVRGISLQLYRTDKDVADAAGLGVASEPPNDQAALRVLRPRFGKKNFGGRILLDPDPLLAAVYVQAGDRDGERVMRALNRLLPSADFDRIRAAPRDYLCRGKAVWVPSESQPDAIQLPLDGSMDTLKGEQLEVRRVFMTRAMLAQRLQQLNGIGLNASIVMAEDVAPPKGTPKGVNLMRRLAVLAVEPRAGAADLAPLSVPSLRACSTPRDAKPPASTAPVAPVVPVAPVAPAGSGGDEDDVPGEPSAGSPAHLCRANDKQSRCAKTPIAPAVSTPLQPRTAREEPEDAIRRNHLDFSVERRPGKPWRLGTAYRHEGKTADDTFALGFGLQKQASGDFSYSGDFANFAGWGRRVQWTARAFSAFDPEVGIDPTRPDERREGTELRVTADLWRDMRYSSAQLEVALRRVEITFDATGSQRQRVSAVDVSLVLTRSHEGTPASERQELVLNASAGRADGEYFGKAGMTLAVRRFVGAFSQWDLRARAHAVSTHTPLEEWVRFGGEDTVRGYKADNTVARQAWALQNEYWMPLPWTPASPEFASNLRRHVALAAFLDMGGVRHANTPLSGASGFKAGAGLGLRYRPYPSTALRLDVARPVGNVADNDRRTRIYFTVTTFTSI